MVDEDELPKAFGRALKKARDHRKLSQMLLATQAGLHLNALGNLERGKRVASLRTVFLICEALGMSPSKFISSVEDELNFWYDPEKRHKKRKPGV